ncbi:MAG: hypothetical protein ACRCXX_13890 [Cetobacterium sp.]|uniref:hypothetical protein n=1 Tax=Cetobacterium sp. TaxID=2071632 RepID=UPI003F2F2177
MGRVVKRRNIEKMLREVLKDDKIEKEFNAHPGEKEVTFVVVVPKEQLLDYLMENFE